MWTGSHTPTSWHNVATKWSNDIHRYMFGIYGEVSNLMATSDCSWKLLLDRYFWRSRRHIPKTGTHTMWKLEGTSQTLFAHVFSLYNRTRNRWMSTVFSSSQFERQQELCSLLHLFAGLSSSKCATWFDLVQRSRCFFFEM